MGDKKIVICWPILYRMHALPDSNLNARFETFTSCCDACFPLRPSRHTVHAKFTNTACMREFHPQPFILNLSSYISSLHLSYPPSLFPSPPSRLLYPSAFLSFFSLLPLPSLSSCFPAFSHLPCISQSAAAWSWTRPLHQWHFHSCCNCTKWNEMTAHQSGETKEHGVLRND